MSRLQVFPRHLLVRIAVAAGVVSVAVLGFALPAAANSGHVLVAQTCSGWSASVTLDNNVTSGKFVEVSTTIPGTTGIVDARYTTTDASGTTPIWDAGGPAPSNGTVTLTILNRDRSVETTASASLPAVQDCAPPTSAEVTTTTLPRPSTTEGATSTTGTPTTTAGVVTSTTLPVAPTTETTTTTTSDVSPLTAFATTTTLPAATSTSTLDQLGGPAPTTGATPPAAANGSLPRTGSGVVFPTLFGLCALTAGAIVTIRERRRAWSRT